MIGQERGLRVRQSRKALWLFLPIKHVLGNINGEQLHPLAHHRTRFDCRFHGMKTYHARAKVTSAPILAETR